MIGINGQLLEWTPESAAEPHLLRDFEEAAAIGLTETLTDMWSMALETAGAAASVAAVLVGAGLAVGATIVHLSAGALERVLFGVTAGDPASTGAASGVLLAAALTACAIPALRAARTRPAVWSTCHAE